MPDITMCDGAFCRLKETCYRFKAEPNPHRQAYFIQSPIIETNGIQHCEFKMKVWNDNATTP